MHQSVMASEAVDALVTRRDGFYVDGTFGRGGHSRRILAALAAEGGLLAVDKDPAAAPAAAELRGKDARFEFERDSFTDLPRLLRRRGRGAVDGILLDLGVSAPQLEDGRRGFSFLRDGPLDMRLDPGRGRSAAEWLAGAGHGEIARVLREFGEERRAGRIAAAILRARQAAPVATTGQLARIVGDAVPAGRAKRERKHPATRTFQAIRIFINNELAELESLLAEVAALLRAGGRLVVISFHSLEDRIVKRFLRRMQRGETLPRRLPVMGRPAPGPLRALGGPRRPSAEEVAANPRARSAVLRAAERLEAAA